jgi:F0F1-type ATP synthase assembly protein I
MVTVSATERPQEERDDEQPDLVLRDAPEPAHRAGPGLAARRHKSWESRFKRGLGEAGEASDKISRGTGWEILSYLLAGMTVYGGFGWVIGHFTHIQILFPIGMVIGVAISLGWVVYRFGRN